jgi:hypothetical protein
LDLQRAKLWLLWEPIRCTYYSLSSSQEIQSTGANVVDCTHNLTELPVALLFFIIISGRAVVQDSGFDGGTGWVPDRLRLDNEFYRVLLSPNGDMATAIFILELQVSNQFLWRRDQTGQHFMLDVDMALAVNFNGFLDRTTGRVTCNLSDDNAVQPICPASSTLSIAVEYADNNRLWVNDFHDAFLKMTNTGCGVGGPCTAL